MDFMKKPIPIEVLLCSIALPGYGQLLNSSYVKGILLIGLEFLGRVSGWRRHEAVCGNSFRGLFCYRRDHPFGRLFWLGMARADRTVLRVWIGIAIRKILRKRGGIGEG